MNRLRLGPAALLALGAILGACGDASGPKVGPPAAIIRQLGDDQSGAAGAALGTPVSVRVNDAQGQAVAGVAVSFSIQAGGGSVSPGQAQTAADGTAQAVWTLGHEAGSEQRLVASFAKPDGGTAAVTFRATAAAGPPVALVKTEGDNQHGGTDAPLTDSLTVRITDAFGNGVPGISVTWSAAAGTVSPTTRTTDASGFARTRWTLGSTAGAMSVQASAGSLPAVTFTATAQPLPTIASITPAQLEPGGSMVITGVNFPADPSANSVQVAGVSVAITAASATEIQATLPASGFGCLPAGNTTVRLTAAGTTTSRLHPIRVVPARSLAVGAALVSSTADPLGCVDLTGTGSRFLIAVTNTAPAVATTTGFRLNAIPAASAPAAATIDPVAGAPALPGMPTLSAAQAQALSRTVQRRTTHREQHDALLRGSTELIDALRHDPATLTARRLRAQAATPQAVPAVGDTLDIRVPRVEAGTSQMCNSFDAIRARVAYVGQHSIVLEDVANTVGGGTLDARFRQLGEEFDAQQYPVVRDNFGDPLLLDNVLNNDGRLYMLFTHRVDGERIAGFVWSGDFLDRTSCPQSNQAEIFYGYTPANPNPEYAQGSVGAWWWDIRSTVIHEVKHLASFASRISQSAPGEESWLEEATAMAAEEIWARQVFGYSANSNVGYTASVGCEIRGAFDIAPCAGRPGVMFGHFMLLSQWLGAPDARSPLGSINPATDGSFYGSGWLFLRWIVETSGRPEAELLSELTQSSTRGAANVEQRTGRSFPAMLGEWALATALDDRPGVVPADPARQIASWNLRDMYAGLNHEQPQLMPTPFPFVATSLGFGGTTQNVDAVRGGGTKYFELSGTAQPLALEFLGAGGTTLPAGLRISVFRIQ